MQIGQPNKNRVSPICPSHVKRFLEVWASDSAFRRELQISPEGARQKRDLLVDPESIRPLWDTNFHTGPDLADPSIGRDFPQISEYCARREKKRAIGQRIREECRPKHPAFRIWRERQIARTATEFSNTLYSAIQHPPFAIELSIGCTVGCWFCGVNAKQFERHMSYTKETSALWKELLSVLQSIIGTEACSRGFLYWATDPLDNPDYERFALDFRDVFYKFPHTTTAQPLKYLSKIRSLLGFATADEPFTVRFSILSKTQLSRIHNEFTPEELAFVEIIPQFSGSITEIVSSGKAKSNLRSVPTRNDLAYSTSATTIACVSGFLINIVDRTVKLITPCRTSRLWPNGYYIIDQATFDSSDDFRLILQKMIDSNMSVSVPQTRLLKFRSDLQFDTIDAGFRLSSMGGRIDFEGSRLITEIGLMIRAEQSNATEIGHWFESEYGLPLEIPQSWLDALFRAGVIDEEPICASLEPIA